MNNDFLKYLMDSWQGMIASLVSVCLKIGAWICLCVFDTKIPQPPERLLNWLFNHNRLHTLEFLADVYFPYGIFRFQNRLYLLDPKLSLKVSRDVDKGASDFLQNSPLKPSLIKLKEKTPNIRRVLDPLFRRSKIEGKGAIMQEVIQRAISKMAEADVVNISDLSLKSFSAYERVQSAYFDPKGTYTDEFIINKTALDVFGRVILGMELGGLEGKQDRLLHAIVNILRRGYALGEVSSDSQVRNFEYLPEFAENCQTLIDETEAIVHGCLEHSTNENSFVHILYKSGTIQQAQSNLKMFLMAGSGTTADAVSVMLYLVTQRPELQRELQHEADEWIDRLRTDASHVPPKLDSALKELLRINSIGFFSFRRNETELNLGKFIIPAKSDLRVFMWGIHRSKNLWNDSKSYCPGRFMTSSTTSHWLPFGAGPRMCIGQHLAWVELRLMMANFLYHFNFRRVIQTKDLEVSVDWEHAVVHTNHAVILGVQKREH